MSIRHLRVVKGALIVAAVLDVLALGAFAVRVDTVTSTVTIPAAPAAEVAAPSAVLPPAAPTGYAAIPAVSTDANATPPAAPRPAKSEPSPRSPSTDEPTPAPEPSAAAVRCPIPVREPTTSGGLQTLIGFAPAFGPFKDEAFAAAAAYQPVLQLLGPILAKYPEIGPRIEPTLTPLLGAFSGLLDAGYTLLGPLYAPHRTEVLEAESKLAAALAPYARELATSPLGGCVVELQSALLEPASASTRTN